MLPHRSFRRVAGLAVACRYGGNFTPLTITRILGVAQRASQRGNGVTSPESVVAGVSVSLSVSLRRQGQEAYDGIRLWVEHVVRAGGLTFGRNRANRPLRLVALDDASSVSRARGNAARLLTEERVDLLLGPYGSGSTLAARSPTAWPRPKHSHRGHPVPGPGNVAAKRCAREKRAF